MGHHNDMAHDRKFRFAAQLSKGPDGTARSWAEQARRAEELRWRRDAYGISYWSIEADCWEALGPVVSRLSGT